MSDPSYLPYQFDRLGNDPANFIIDEPHLINQSTSKVVLVTHGLFYTHDFIIRHENSAVPLTLGVDYEFVGQDTYITAKTNLENASAIQLKSTAIEGRYLISHRLVGGKEGMLNTFVSYLIEALEAAKNSSVEFSSLKNRPYQYPGEQHTHVLSDLQRWEDVNTLLLMIRDAILDTRSLGSSALSLAQQDQRLLQLIAELQGEINSINARLNDLIKRIDKFQRFDFDFGELTEVAPRERWSDVDTFRQASIDMGDPYNRVDPEAPISPALLSPGNWSKGVNRFPLLVGSLLVNGRLKTIQVPLTVDWKILDEDGETIIITTRTYTAGTNPTLDLFEEEIELTRNKKYEVYMTYSFNESAWPLDPRIPFETEYQTMTAWFRVTDSRLETVALMDNAYGDTSNFGRGSSVSADGMLISVGVQHHNGGQTPRIYYYTDDGWKWTDIPLPLIDPTDNGANRTADTTLVDPKGQWVLVGGRHAGLVRKYPLATLRSESGRYSVVATRPVTSIPRPAAMPNGAFGTAMKANASGSVVVIGADIGDGMLAIYSVAEGTFTRLQVVDFNEGTSRWLGGIGLELAISDDSNTIVAGSYRAEDGSGNRLGALFVLRRKGTEWMKQPMFMEASATVDGAWGNNIAMNGNADTVAVMEIQGNTYRGMAYIYSLDKVTGELVQTQKIKPQDYNTHNYRYMAMSNDGKTLLLSTYPTGDEKGKVTQFRRMANGKFVLRRTIEFPGDNMLPRNLIISNNGETATFDGNDRNTLKSSFVILR